MADSRSTGGGIGVCGVLGTVFVVLKLCGVIDWSWWWVLAPFWMPVSLLVAVIVVLLIVLGITRMIAKS